jgi:hypothetical protein
MIMASARLAKRDPAGVGAHAVAWIDTRRLLVYAQRDSLRKLPFPHLTGCPGGRRV